MNFSNLIVTKSTMVSDARDENGNDNKIRIRVPAVPGTRKIQIVPSSSSPSAAVVAASSKTAPVCNHHTEYLFQNYANFKKSAEPARFMFYQNKSWIDFEDDVLEMLKLGFLEGKPVIEAVVEGKNCLFDFHRMLKIEFESVSQRSIAWIDVNDKSFFPKVYVDSSGDSKVFEIEDVSGKEKVKCAGPKIEIEINVSGEGKKKPENIVNLEEEDVNLIKRKRGSDENGVSSSNTEFKRIQIMDNEESMWPKTKVLTEREHGYTMIKNSFLSGLAAVDPSARITVIHKCNWSGLMDKARLEIFQKQIELTKKYRGDANVVHAWYGTSAKGVETILAHGFGSPSKVSASSAYGVGVYLSPVAAPQKSAILSEIDKDGEKHLVLCRVILGKCEKVAAGSNQANPSSVNYDSGVDDPKNPELYVVWPANMNTHIIPEYVVSYKPANCAPGQVNGRVPEGEKMLVGRLYSKLSTRLPPSKVRGLQILCTSFMEGKLGKDVFMKQLQVMVGDEMVRSAFQEIRG